MSTSIEWTRNADGTQGKTWNPTLGCSKVSPGCDGCYAISVAHRAMTPAHKGLTVLTDNGPDWTGEVRCLPERLDIPLKRRKPTTWFVDSMSDLFHPDVPEVFIGSVWATMARTPQHTYQVLTKRPQRMTKVLTGWAEQTTGSAYGGPSWRDHQLRWNESRTWPLPNVWLGTSIESDRYTWRADHLRQTSASVRWLSLEPLLGHLPSLDLTGIDWVVAGGESGPKARPMHPDWVHDIRDRCVEAGIPLLFKQWGEWAPGGHPTRDSRFVDLHGRWQLPNVDGSVLMHRAGKKAAGRELDGQVWDQMPEVSRG